MNSLREHPLTEKAGETLEYTKHFIQQRIDYVKLEVADRATVVLSDLSATIAVAILGFLAFVFALITLAFYVATLTESYVIGFGSVTGFVIVLAILVYVLRRPLISSPFSKMMISKLFTK